MTDQELQELRDWSAGLMGWHREHRSGLWTVTECYAGECDIWIDQNGVQQAKAEDDGYVFGQFWQPYSKETGQIWLVVERMRELGWEFHLSCYGDGSYSASFNQIYGECPRNAYIESKTAPCHAILLAAKATGVV